MKALALFLLAGLTLFLPASAFAKEKETSKQSIVSQGKERTYFLFIPKTLKPETPAQPEEPKYETYKSGG